MWENTKFKENANEDHFHDNSKTDDDTNTSG